jgi:uncharacterized membrane protein YgcG
MTQNEAMGRIRVGSLGLVVGAWTVNVVGSKISAHSELLCAHPADHLYRTVEASARDSNRWHRATDELLARIRALQEQEQAASLHLHPSRYQLWWHIRYARRNWSLRRGYQATAARLRAEFDAAIAGYLEQAGDLTTYVERQWRRASESRLREGQAGGRGQRSTESRRSSGPSSTYGSDGGAGGFSGGSF